MKQLTGLIPAVFTPMHEDGSVHLQQIPKMVEHLLRDNVTALYVCGSTGEGLSLTTEERNEVAEAYIRAAEGKLPVIVNVGHNSIKDAQRLAGQAQKFGADAFSAVPPSYFKIDSLSTLVACVAEIATAAPELPFYYYHIPAITGVDFDMAEFLEMGRERIANLAGIKYSNHKIFELQACLEFDNGIYDILFGRDEMLLAALSAGATGAVGTTYNFAAPLYNKIIREFDQGRIESARELQSFSIRMVKLLYGYGGMPAFKAVMKLLGVDCGPTRLPFIPLGADEIKALEKDLMAAGFFDWGRNS